jgi:ubiquinone/menaquinone biosynthesis C-methylase UbiE
MRQREKVVPGARGRVLEVGIGSGLNLRYYDASKVTKIWGLDPSPEMTRIAEQAARALGLEVEFVDLPADEIPLDDHSVDTVVVTYTLCTIPETAPALQEMARVLHPDGELIFCEHDAAPDVSVRRWQDRLNPLMKRLGGGCHLNRPIPALIEAGGFRIKDLQTMYIPGWRPVSFNYWGSAVPR